MGARSPVSAVQGRRQSREARSLFTFQRVAAYLGELTIMAGAPLMVVAINLGHRDTRMSRSTMATWPIAYIGEMSRRIAPQDLGLKSWLMTSTPPRRRN